MKQQLLSLIFVLVTFFTNAQIGIGTSSPDPSSILDVQSTTKGFLAPRINLSSVTNSSIDGSNTNAAGLMIYNTNASVTGGSGVGYYYWDGSTWTAMKASTTGGGSGDGWQLDGNSISSGDFLGTTNYQALNLRVNNTQISSFHPNGGISFGLGASSSIKHAFAIGENASAGNTSNYAFGKGANASGSSAYAIGESSVSSQNKSYAIGTSSTASGTSSYAIGEGSASLATGSYAIGAGANSSATGSFAIGNQSISASNNTLALGNEAQAINNNATALGYQAIASNQNSIAIGPATTSVDNSIILGNTTNTTTDSYAATKVGIGTNAPSAKLHVNGTLRYVDGNQAAGRVLTSDANGNATWETPSSGGGGASSSVYGEIFKTTTTSGIETYSPITFGNNSPNSGLNGLSSTNIQTAAATGTYKITYTISVRKTSGGGNVNPEIEFFITQGYGASNKINGSSTYVSLSSGIPQATVTRSILVNVTSTYQQFYVFPSITSANVSVLPGSSLTLELID